MKADVLSDVLRAVRLTGAVYFDFELSSPWVAEAPPSREIAGKVMPGAQRVIEYHLIARGACWGHAIGQEPIRLREGDLIVFPQGDAHVLSSAPGMRAAPDMSVFARPSTPLPLVYELGGGGPERARVVCGFLGCDERPYNPLLTALPAVIHLSAAGPARDDRVARHAAEHRREGVGQRASGRRERPGASFGTDVCRGDPPVSRDAPARPDGLARGIARPGGRTGAGRAAWRAEPSRGRSNGWRDSWASRVRSSRSDSRKWSANRRCSTSRCGACSSPRACWSKAARWRRSPAPSATNRKRRSAARSRSWWARLRRRGGEARPRDADVRPSIQDEEAGRRHVQTGGSVNRTFAHGSDAGQHRRVGEMPGNEAPADVERTNP